MRSAKILGLLMAAVTGLLGLAAPAQATDDLLFGQRHFYSVTLRGNGEAVVTARVVFSNQTDQPQTSFAFKAVGIEPTEMVGYQQTIAAGCAQYERQSTTFPQPPCVQYSEPDYLAMYATGTSTYAKLSIESGDNGAYRIKLSKAVAPGDSSAILLSYAGKGFVQNHWGIFSYNVRTLEVNERVKQAAVALDVDEGLFMKDPQGKVNYETTAPAQDLTASGSTASAKSLDAITYRLGTYGMLNKTANDLAAGETFSVTGQYADSAWKLNLWGIGLLLLILVGAVVGLGFGWRRWRKGHHGTAGESAIAKSTAEPSSAAVALSPAGNWTSWWFDPAVVGLALLSVLVTAGVTWVFATWMDKSDVSDNFLVMSLLLLMLMGYVLLIFGPAGWLAWRRRDIRAGAVVFVWQVACLVMLLAAYQFVLAPLFDGTVPPPDVVPMSSGSSGGGVEELKAN